MNSVDKVPSIIQVCANDNGRLVADNFHKFSRHYFNVEYLGAEWDINTISQSRKLYEAKLTFKWESHKGLIGETTISNNYEIDKKTHDIFAEYDVDNLCELLIHSIENRMGTNIIQDHAGLITL